MRDPNPIKKTAPAKATRPVRDGAASKPVAFAPTVGFKPTLVPLPNGNFEVVAGKPIVTQAGDFIGTQEFAKLTGLSQRHVVRLCDEGKIKHRRRSELRKSEYRIPRSEVERYLNIEETEETT